MGVVGRFEILSPVFSGAVDTSTARDPQSGETVLLHLLPPGHEDSPREFFLELAPGCPGRILDYGIDPETKRAFVVTDYPKDRKAVRLWIRELSGIGTPPAPKATPPASPAPTKAPVPFTDPLEAFRTPVASARPAAPESPGGGATRMFDPSAVFGVAASPVPKEQPKAAPSASDSGTRMFDPSAVFGSAPSAAPSTPAAAPKPPVSASDSGTRMFDPSAVFGASAAPPPAKKEEPKAAPAPEGATRMFDPSAVFGAPVAKPKAPAKESVRDSSKKAAEDFIAGKLPAEFRDAPTKVQRSLEELLGRKAQEAAKKSKESEEPPTPGRPGVITLMFDAYGKRIEHAEAASSPPAADPRPQTGAPDKATKMISSADLSAFFAAEESDSDNHPDKDSTKSDPPRNRK